MVVDSEYTPEYMEVEEEVMVVVSHHLSFAKHEANSTAVPRSSAFSKPHRNRLYSCLFPFVKRDPSDCRFSV